MSPKKLEPKSRYAQYDLDGDGVVTDEELARNQDLVDLHLTFGKFSGMALCKSAQLKSDAILFVFVLNYLI